MTDKIQNFIDRDFEPLDSERKGPVHGLVVGTRKTEAEFEALAVALNAMSKAGTMPDVLFEDENGLPMKVGAPGRDAGD